MEISMPPAARFAALLEADPSARYQAGITSPVRGPEDRSAPASDLQKHRACELSRGDTLQTHMAAGRPSTAAEDGPQSPQRHGQRGQISAAGSVEFREGLASAANGGCMTALPRRHGSTGGLIGLWGLRRPGLAQDRGGELAQHGVEVVP
jgi:hypothetical protein